MSPKNSFSHAPNELNFRSYIPEDVKPAVDFYARKLTKDVNKIIGLQSLPTYENRIAAYFKAWEDIEKVCGLANHLSALLGEKWHAAELYADGVYSRLFGRYALDVRIYNLFVDVLTNDKNLTEYQKNLLSKTIHDFEKGGINLDNDSKSRLRRIYSSLTRLSNKFSQNVIKQDGRATVLFESKDDLKGLSQEFIDRMAKSAKDNDKQGYLFKYNPPDYLKIMTRADKQSTRDRVHDLVAAKDRGPNLKIINIIIKLRQELSSILGYASFADYVLEDRMAKTPDTVCNFIANLKRNYLPLRDAETERLELFAAKITDNPNFQLPNYEANSGIDLYYGLKHKASIYQVDEHQLEAYWPLDNIRDYMFTFLNRLYGVSIQAASTTNKWHKEVQVYDVVDADGSCLARVWCDFLNRPNKQAGAWQNEYWIAPRHNNDKQPHMGYVVCNFPRPEAGKPSLLSHEDVQTLWHEFGHFMHLALSATQLKEQSMSACKWDFIEAPSQIMENFVWQPEILMEMSEHYLTKTKPERKQIDNLVASRNYRVGSKAIRQLWLAEADLGLHTRYNPESDNLLEFTQNIWPDPKTQDTSKDYRLLSFSHIFAGGYAAGYYSYKWAEAIEADLFTRFKDGQDIRTVGHEYRTKILAKGAELDPMILIEDFLGRKFDTSALLRRDGAIVKPS